ncbi:hypothetical protein [Sphingomonas sp. DBB INV C78]|uniref:hypothetical protein n=1 Tax=Sphingomonas sp. DBB INV C78 TaxID=3349434 RepID=UPI0036D27BF7
MTDPESPEPQPVSELADILRRLRQGDVNPVSRARAWVEAVVPSQERGPGWDRHWRELEAYAAGRGVWSSRRDGGDGGAMGE